MTDSFAVTIGLPWELGGAPMFRHIAASLVVSAIMVVVLGPSSGAAIPDPIQARGCCSHHGGVAGGCCGTTVRCNDGTCSPSCGC
jgi:hypothetical protein